MYILLFLAIKIAKNVDNLLYNPNEIIMLKKSTPREAE